MLLFMIAMYNNQTEKGIKIKIYNVYFYILIVVMMGGIAITVFDQVITQTSPIILSCVVVGIVF